MEHPIKKKQKTKKGLSKSPSFVVKQKFQEIVLEDREVEERRALRNIRMSIDYNKEHKRTKRLTIVDWRVTHATIIFLSFLSEKKLEKGIKEQKKGLISDLQYLENAFYLKQKEEEDKIRKNYILENKSEKSILHDDKKVLRKISKVESKNKRSLKKSEKELLKDVNKKEVETYNREKTAREDMTRFLSSAIYGGLYFFTNEVSTSMFETHDLILKNVSKKMYTEGKILEILDDISFSVKKGEMVAIMGQSGSGKTTLLNIISGIDGATSGDVLFCGTNLTYLSDKDKMRFRKKNVSIVFQGHNLLDNISVYANAVVGKSFSSKKIKRKNVIDVLKNLGLYELRHKFPTKLSGGQKQRVALARAILKYPKILFCDEPTASLDKETANEIMALLKQLREKYGTTIIIITHTPSIAKAADRVLQIESGKLKEVQKSKAEIVNNEVVDLLVRKPLEYDLWITKSKASSSSI